MIELGVAQNTFKMLNEYAKAHTKILIPEKSRDKLYLGGQLHYMNGNDGTEFDWKTNERTCEFMSFYNRTMTTFLRLFVYRDGYLRGYAYSMQNPYIPYQELQEYYIGVENAAILAKTLYEEADNKGKFNVVTTQIDLRKDRGSFR